MAPRRLVLSEVSLRDGLQTEKAVLATDRKLALVEALLAAGLTRIEVTGFVHPKVIPQFADAEAVAAGLPRREGVRYAAFVPNARGAERAVAAGIDDLKCGVAASDSFNLRNVRMTTEEGMRAVEGIARVAEGTPSRIAGVVATAFGCPYEGAVDPARVERLFAQMVELGAPVIYLADTTGMANPASIRATVSRLRDRWPGARIGLHLHNTRGLGLANALAGIDLGVEDLEGSVGGIGGCPFAPLAVGNVCTEDLVHMAEGMGIETRLDLDALIAAARLAQELLGRDLPGMVLKAGRVATRA